MSDKFNNQKKSTMKITTNKARFMNGEPFKTTPYGSYYRYICNEYDTGYLVQLYTGSNDTNVLFEQHESNVSKIGPTTCKAFRFVLGNRVNTCIRFDRISFEVKLEEKYFKENKIERIES